MALKSTWVDFVYKSATGTKKVRTLLTPIGAIVFGLFIFCFIFISLQTDRLFNLPVIVATPWNLFIGLPVLIIGALFTGWSVYHFLKHKGTPVPMNPPPGLVKSGPYQHTRNPMLTGIFLLMFGIGFWIGSLSLVLVFTPLFILLNTLELKKIEEPELERRLGKDYQQYKKRIPMYIPRLHHTKK